MTRSVWRSEVRKKRIAICENSQRAEKRTPAWPHGPQDVPGGEERCFRLVGLTDLIQARPDKAPLDIAVERLSREILEYG